MNEVRYIPIAKCPVCRHNVIYSSDPKKKKSISLIKTTDSSGESIIMCSKCKTMLEIKKTVPKPETVTLPIFRAI